MYYLLNPNVALRSWRLVPYAYYVRYRRNAMGLKQEEYELLSQCDGQHDLKDSDLLESLVQRGLAVPCSQGETLTEWQKPRVCDNRYFPAMNWMITGKCNYNCLHCFNAADNARLQSEFTWEEAQKLIEEAAECGINEFILTGGEPMMHPHFLDIVREIYRHGMYVGELNTNGAFLNEQVLDEMKHIGCVPMMKISFDGVGHHDWLRNRAGAEADALRAIKLCVAKGFPVMAQTNVHRHNVDSMLDTLRLLDSVGVSTTRIIRTSESPRWVQNAKDACLGLTEYYDRMLDLLKEYSATGAKMNLIIWQFVDFYPRLKQYNIHPVAYTESRYRDSRPVCQGNRGMVAVTAGGNVVPCHQMSGYYEHQGDRLGNVKQDGLKPYLQSGAYLCEVCTTLETLRKRNAECGACQHFKQCAGGCRAIALALTGDKLGKDPSKCLFFQGGYVQKVEQAMQGYERKNA